MADSECIARAELRAVLESGGAGLPQQWRAAFRSPEDALVWVGQHHPNLLARNLFAAVAELSARFKAQLEVEASYAANPAIEAGS